MDGKKFFSEDEKHDSNDSQKNCLSDLTFLKFVEGNLSEDEQQAVLTHLNSCPKCLELLAIIGKVSPHPFTSPKKIAEFNPDNKSQQRQVDLILQYIKIDQEKSAHKTPAKNQSSESSNHLPSTSSLTKIKFDLVTSFFKAVTNSMIPWATYPVMSRYAIKAVTVVSFFIIAGAGGVYLFRHYPVWAFDHNLEQLSDYYKDGKLSGKIGMRRIPELLSSTESSDSDSAQVAQVVQQAKKILRSGNKSPGFLHNYTKLLIIAENFSTADSLARELQKNTGNSAELLNDIGVLYFRADRKKEPPDYTRAEHFLEEAIKLNPKFKDAYFNLALVMIEKDNIERAKKLLEKYFELQNANKDEIWLPAAKALKLELESAQN